MKQEGFAIKIENLNISFNNVSVLKNANFSLEEGEIHALAGKNGAGKSTLMKAITGINPSGKHCIKVFGKSFDKYTTKEALESKIAMVYQDLSLVKTMSISQNIFLNNYSFNKFGIINDDLANEKSKELLSSLGMIDIDVNTLVSDISVGEAQLVEIAKALANEPKILILDEPTASLTSGEVTNLFEAVKMLQVKGISIVYITHYLDDIMSLCDGVSVLRDGKIISSCKTEETSIDQMITDMLGEDNLSERKWRDKKRLIDKSETPLLELKDISTSYINNINLKLYKGEIVGLAGLLGSGRTEILDLIYGLTKKDTGELLIEGNTVAINSVQDAIKNKISMSPEERRTQGLVLEFSIKHNLVMPILDKISNMFMINLKNEKKISDYYIPYLNIKCNGAEQAAKYLSGGNQQKIVIGKCLASKSNILLLNDPTFGIDIQSKLQIMNIIKEYVKEGNCVIFVSSEFKEIADFCDRTYIVKKRQIVKELVNDGLTEEKLLQEVQ